MKVYVFGNEDYDEDAVAFKVADKLRSKVHGTEFVEVKPNEDLPFAGKKKVVILDVVEGLEKVRLISEKDIDRLTTLRSLTAHDFDLAFQLKYLKKLGKLAQIQIIGLPQRGKINYSLIQSILRKLVAQEMQGS